MCILCRSPQASQASLIVYYSKSLVSSGVLFRCFTLTSCPNVLLRCSTAMFNRDAPLRCSTPLMFLQLPIVSPMCTPKESKESQDISPISPWSTCISGFCLRCSLIRPSSSPFSRLFTDVRLVVRLVLHSSIRSAVWMPVSSTIY